MKSKPMLGDHELSGVESIVSAETRSLAEHAVPGLAGSYLQDLGSEANTILITGSMHGDEHEQTFLKNIRGVFNRNEPVPFVADINTATDITDVVIEELDVAEVAASEDRFRYRIKIRKYVPPPEPVAPSLLDDSLLDQAADLFEQAANAIDALTSIPDLADPTPPLRDSLSDVRSTTDGLDDSAAELQDLISGGAPPAAGTPSGLPDIVDPASVSIDPADPRIDPETGPVLEDMLQDPDVADTAARLVLGVQDGTVAGITGDDSEAAQQLADAYGTQPSEIIPPGEDAAVVLDPASRLAAPPTILLRPEAREDPARLGPALQEAHRTLGFHQRRELAPRDTTPAADPVANLVPSTFGHVPAAKPVPVGGPDEGGPADFDPSGPDPKIDPADPRIDVGAKFALQRMLKRPDMRVDAARLIHGINHDRLEGIYGDDLGKAVEVARAHGTERWLLVPKGEDAALVLDAATPLNDLTPPTVIFRGDTPDIRDKPARIDPALQKASQTYDLWLKDQIGPCQPTGTEPVSNLVLNQA